MFNFFLAIRRMLIGFLVALLAANPGFSGQQLPAPSGPVVLRITGDIGVTNVGSELQFDLDLLRSLPMGRIETQTIWTKGPQVFEGVWLETIVETLGLSSGMLEASALNEYLVDIPLSDAVDQGALIAYKMNGNEMSVREKGPLWLVYPYDDNPDYRSEVYYSRSIWQLDTITVLP